MNKRAQHLIASLELDPHPEGGYYREIIRVVGPGTAGGKAVLYTDIYYLITNESFSRFHRIGQDEIWNFHEGSTVCIYDLHPRDFRLTTHRLGESRPEWYKARIPGKHWQAAVPREGYALLSCTVIPGFDFREFSLLKHSPREVEKLARRHPDLTGYL